MDGFFSEDPCSPVAENEYGSTSEDFWRPSPLISLNNLVTALPGGIPSEHWQTVPITPLR